MTPLSRTSPGSDRLAPQLGAGTMTLYNYVRTKDELIALRDDKMMGELLVSEEELARPWRCPHRHPPPDLPAARAATLVADRPAEPAPGPQRAARRRLLQAQPSKARRLAGRDSRPTSAGGGA
jgi:hypothetical protein